MPSAVRRMPNPRGSAMTRGQKNPPPPGNMYRKVTPQGKLQMIADRLGIPGIKDQQGTTRTIYHFLPLVQGLNAIVTYPFFKAVKNTTFPFTNITENKLEAGEMIAVERHYFVIMSTDATTGEVTAFDTFDSFAVPAFYGGTYNLKIGSQDYTKDTSLMAFKPEFNTHATHINYNVYHTAVDTGIPPDLQFVMNVTMPEMTIPTSTSLDFWIGCFIEGAGSILNMKNNL